MVTIAVFIGSPCGLWMGPERLAGRNVRLKEIATRKYSVAIQIESDKFS
jgi:hypothetical protein